MNAPSSKTRIDQLGDRLRQDLITESELELLDDHRRSFLEAYLSVVTIIRERLSLETTGRPAKSTSSIIEKLRRETIRLSQMQDIAGCRIVVADAPDQAKTVSVLRAEFPDSSLVDRRTNPSYGYRAVHLIVEISGKLIEIQVRTVLQNAWAELSEKFSDAVDPAIKYGGGVPGIREVLDTVSQAVASREDLEIRVAQLEVAAESAQELQILQERMARDREGLLSLCQGLLTTLEDVKRSNP